MHVHFNRNMVPPQTMEKEVNNMQENSEFRTGPTIGQKSNTGCGDGKNSRGQFRGIYSQGPAAERRPNVT